MHLNTGTVFNIVNIRSSQSSILSAVSNLYVDLSWHFYYTSRGMHLNTGILIGLTIIETRIIQLVEWMACDIIWTLLASFYCSSSVLLWKLKLPLLLRRQMFHRNQYFERIAPENGFCVVWSGCNCVSLYTINFRPGHLLYPCSCSHFSQFTLKGETYVRLASLFFSFFLFAHVSFFFFSSYDQALLVFIKSFIIIAF